MDQNIVNIDIIILANTVNDEVYQMNLNCINSILNSESPDKFQFYIVLVESNKEATYLYPNTLVVKPEEKFGYNKFMLIGLKHAGKGDFVAFCNNDLLFYPNWMSEIVEVEKANQQFQSFSPIDITWPGMSNIDITQKYHEGYFINTFISGWCLILKKGVVDKFPRLLDPYFDFYCADDNYSYALRLYNLKHALISKSKVKHLGSQSTNKNIEKNYLIDLERAGIKYPFYFKSRRYLPTVRNKGYLNGHLKMYHKWGGIYSLAVKNKFFSIFPFLKTRLLTKLLYSIRLPF